MGAVIGSNWLADGWTDLDPWWDEYADIGHETAIELANLLERSTDEWTNSNAPFDTDPLAANLTQTQLSRGPLQPGNEVEWSRWLAQLLYPSKALVSELFEVSVETPPSEVIREDRLSKHAGGFRRPDILVCHADRGISIEVKLDDENYRKTPETAALVEQHYADREWPHTLLLPKRQTGRLESIVDPSLETDSDGKRSLDWETPGPIRVLDWQDVTAAIRSVLRQGAAVDDHWAANAFLFCAVAEQHISGFQSEPSVRRLAEPRTIVDATVSVGVATSLAEQLTYLRESVDETPSETHLAGRTTNVPP
ncbi:hypothetical protein [Halovivax gelatinilyticus]|uniref:hypothetical protein n=1 Tax=Halovivax gelatinilyticus TaxID=2961597 RepID=UPI0020CA981A|nr:hypothetical protein [Halovivax gelatinilyticus]